MGTPKTVTGARRRGGSKKMGLPDHVPLVKMGLAVDCPAGQVCDATCQACTMHPLAGLDATTAKFASMIVQSDNCAIRHVINAPTTRLSNSRVRCAMAYVRKIVRKIENVIRPVGWRTHRTTEWWDAV